MTGLAVSLTVEELRALVREEVRAALVPTSDTAAPSEVMTRAQVAKLLNVNPHQVPKLIRRESMPAHPFGKNGWRFVRSEILEWVAKRKVEAA